MDQGAAAMCALTLDGGAAECIPGEIADLPPDDPPLVAPDEIVLVSGPSSLDIEGSGYGYWISKHWLVAQGYPAELAAVPILLDDPSIPQCRIACSQDPPAPSSGQVSYFRTTANESKVRQIFVWYCALREKDPLQFDGLVSSGEARHHAKAFAMVCDRIVDATGIIDTGCARTQADMITNSYDFWQEYIGQPLDLVELDELVAAGRVPAGGEDKAAWESKWHAALKAAGAIIRDTCKMTDFLPAVRSLIYLRGKAGPEFDSIEDMFLAAIPLRNSPTCTDELATAFARLVKVAWDSPWAPILLTHLRNELGSNMIYAQLGLELGRSNREDPLAKIALREIRYVFHEGNWRSICENPFLHPFIFDTRFLTHHSAFDSFSETVGVTRALRITFGFSVNKLDLSKCGITGSTASFVLGGRAGRRPLGNEYPHSLVCENLDEALGRQFPSDDDIRDTKYRLLERKGANLFLFDVTRTGLPNQQVLVKHAFDIDIAVFEWDSAKFDAIVRTNFEIIKREYPDVTLEKRERGKGHTWHIITGEASMLRLPPVEFFRSTLAGICSHHVAPARACYTAAYPYPTDGEPTARWIATASAIRAYRSGRLDNFYYFASRVMFPQEIVAKYIARGYTLSEHVPEQIRHEVLRYVVQWARRTGISEPVTNFIEYRKAIYNRRRWILTSQIVKA